ncbi:MAG: BrnT family toxin [Parcubacteria group bacterium]|jgi:hypothetical protein
MKINLAQISGFDWDKGNLRKNKDKHDVDNFECEEVFFNKPLFFGLDKAHSLMEERRFVLGITDAGRKLSLTFTVRKSLIRIISARDMSKKEREKYERNQKI